MTTEIEKRFLMIWTADSETPGKVNGGLFKENELATHNKDEVLGPYREYVEVLPGTNLYMFYVTPNLITPDSDLYEVDPGACTYNWETGDLDLVYKPDPVWDDIRLARNGMLAASDNMFNVDTPDPLKSEWVAYRALLREMISREQAAGRTPRTVFWNDYVPPYPLSARNGVPDDIKPLCVWYVEGKYESCPPLPTPPQPNSGE